MASKISVKTTYEPARVIEPIYTGGTVSLSKSGKLLASCVEEDVLLVDLETGEGVIRVEGDGEPITSLILSPQAQHLVVCSRSLSMRIYALNETAANIQRTLKPHTTPVITSTIDPSGTLLATGGADGTVKVWDIRKGYSTHNFHGHGGVISALHFFQPRMGKPRKGERPSETTNIFLASGSEDGKIRIWNLWTSKSVASLDSHVSVIKSLDFSSQQQTLLSASRDKTIIFWDAKSWKPRRVVPALEVVEAAGFIANGESCYSGGQNGRVRIWNTISGKEMTVEQIAGAEEEAISDVQSSQDFLLSVHLDQTLRFHSLRSFPPDGDKTRHDPLPIVQRISGNHDEIIDLALIGADRSLLALATNTQSVRIVSLGSTDFSSRFGADVALLSGHSEIIICLDVDWSGHWLATGAKDNTARLWRLDPAMSSYTCFAYFVGHAQSLGAIALPRTPSSPQAATDPLNHPPTYLITGSQDRTIKRWDTSSLKLSQPSAHSVSRSLYTRIAHDKDINALDVSPDSSVFASASQDRNIKIWDLESGSTLGILRGHKRGVWSIRFAPKDAPAVHTESGTTTKGLIVSGSGDRTVKLWSLNTYSCILTFEGHSNSVLKVLWLSPPARAENDEENDHQTTNTIQNTHPIIASASSDTLIKLWSPYSTSQSQNTVSLSEDHLLTTLDNHSDRIWALATPTTTTTTPSKNPVQTTYPLISGSADSTISFWTDTTSTTLANATATASLRIEQDQDLQNHIHSQNYHEAVRLALQLDHPARLLALFEDVLNSNQNKTEKSSTGSPQLDETLCTLPRNHLYTLLLRLRDWNTSARTAPTAQRILYFLLTHYPASTFAEMSRDRSLARSGASSSSSSSGGVALTAKSRDGKSSSSGLRDVFRALEVYTARHLSRMQDLVDQGFLIEYTLGCMDEGGVGGGREGVVEVNGVNGDGKRKGEGGEGRVGDEDGEGDGDVIML